MAENWAQWEHLHHRNWQVPQIRAYYFLSEMWLLNIYPHTSSHLTTEVMIIESEQYLPDWIVIMIKSDHVSEALRTLAHIKHYISIC